MGEEEDPFGLNDCMHERAGDGNVPAVVAAAASVNPDDELLGLGDGAGKVGEAAAGASEQIKSVGIKRERADKQQAVREKFKKLKSEAPIKIIIDLDSD